MILTNSATLELNEDWTKRAARLLKRKLSSVVLKQKTEPASSLQSGDGQPDSKAIKCNVEAEPVQENAVKRADEVPSVANDKALPSATTDLKNGWPKSSNEKIEKLVTRTVSVPAVRLSAVTEDKTVKRSVSHDCKVRLLRVGKEKYIVKRDSDEVNCSDNDANYEVEETPTSPASENSRSSVSSLNLADITDNTLVVCPLCPKQLLCRLLPVHIKFHGSSCRYKCTKCSFSSSYKLVALVKACLFPLCISVVYLLL